MKNIESAIKEERILDIIEEKMALVEIKGEKQMVDLVPLEEES